MRLMQHKREAYWFYRFLSNFYDSLVNPLFWTEPMRDRALQLAELDDRNLSVIDVGSGTGFTTRGIVNHVYAGRVTCIDQSPHQMARARRKEDLRNCTFKLGDAENLPVPTDTYDRYVSAGSIEYWPDPQSGINEAYRVIKPGGIALLIGPLEPEGDLARFVTNTWMLFPKEEEYFNWFKKAGFTDIRHLYVRPHWVRKDRYGIAISGRKPEAGLSPAAEIARTFAAPPIPRPLTLGESLLLTGRVIAGSLAGFLCIPIALIGYARYELLPPPPQEPEVPATVQPLNTAQKGVLAGMVIVTGLLLYRALRR